MTSSFINHHSYRLNFVSLRYFAMIFMFISQLGTLMTFVYYFNNVNGALDAFFEKDYLGLIVAFSTFKLTGPYATVLQIMRSLGSLVPPLYFAATVAFALNLRRDQLVQTTLRNGFVSIIFFIFEIVFTILIMEIAMVMVLTIIMMFEDQQAGFIQFIDSVLEYMQWEYNGQVITSIQPFISQLEVYAMITIGVLIGQYMPSFNTFLDLFLCLLMCLALCTHPKWANNKWKKGLLRSLAAIPIAYIIAAFVLRGLHNSGIIYLNITYLSAFPSKKLIFFVFFGFLLFNNSWHGEKSLKPESGMSVIPRFDKKYLGNIIILESKAAAKKRVLESAAFLSIMLLLLSAVDFCFVFTSFGADWGLGKSYYAALCIPIFFFFDDRKPVLKKDYTVFNIIYIGGLLLFVLAYFLQLILF